jgi:dTDP-4-amino-4,6-dideoxy-D-galactose acyltransferase
LAATLAALKKVNIKLVYWASASEDPQSQAAAKTLQGFLADQKVTYLMPLTPAHKTLTTHNVIEEYPEKTPSAALEFLALQSGLYSRFKADPKISDAIFEKIYKLWIANSVNKQVAQAVLIIKKNQQLAGMITLGDKNNRGDIGLLAVHPDYRGLKIGSDLVYAGQAWFANHSFTQSQVVTQLTNKPACALYEKYGYSIEKIENFYHFWL